MAVMLIWMTTTSGGPATIQFSSLAACEAARPIVEREFPKPWASGFETKCVEVPR